MAVRFGGDRNNKAAVAATEPDGLGLEAAVPEPRSLEEQPAPVMTESMPPEMANVAPVPPPTTMMVTGPAKSEEQNLVAFQGGGALAFFDFAQDPFALFDFNGADNNLGQTLPLRRIEYCASKGTENLRKGLITDMSTMQQKPSIRAVLVAMKFSRVWMPEYDPTAEVNEPLCASLDGSRRTKGTDTRIPEEQLCAHCPRAKWAPGAKHPDCSEVYTLLMLDVEDQYTPFLLNVRRTGIKPLRTFRNALKATAFRVWNAASGVPANLCVEFALSAAAEKNYYLPAFTELTTIPIEKAAELAQRLAPIIQTFNKQDTTETLLDDMDDDGAGEADEGDVAVMPPAAPARAAQAPAQAPAAQVAAAAGPVRRFGAGR